MNNFQSIAALAVVLVTAFIMLYAWLKKRGSSCCSDGCAVIKPNKPSKKP